MVFVSTVFNVYVNFLVPLRTAIIIKRGRGGVRSRGLQAGRSCWFCVRQSLHLKHLLAYRYLLLIFYLFSLWIFYQVIYIEAKVVVSIPCESRIFFLKSARRNVLELDIYINVSIIYICPFCTDLKTHLYPQLSLYPPTLKLP